MKKTILFFITIFLLLTFTSNSYAQTGNVGIGTSSPDEKLEVNGNIKDLSFSTIWKSTGTYTLNYLVAYNGNFYRNLTGTNTATTPNSDFTNWVNISSEPNFLHANMSSDENISTNDDIDNLTMIAGAGVLGANGFTSSGIITLVPGITYKLTAAINMNSSSSATYVVYQWRDLTNGVLLGNPAFIYKHNLDTTASDQHTAIAYFTPTAATQIHLQIKEVFDGTASIDAEYGYITVEAL